MRKTFFFEKCSWFKFHNFELALGMAFKFYTSVTKRLKLKVRKFLGLILTFVKVSGETGWEHFFASSIVNRVNGFKG